MYVSSIVSAPSISIVILRGNIIIHSGVQGIGFALRRGGGGGGGNGVLKACLNKL